MPQYVSGMMSVKASLNDDGILLKTQAFMGNESENLTLVGNCLSFCGASPKEKDLGNTFPFSSEFAVSYGKNFIPFGRILSATLANNMSYNDKKNKSASKSKSVAEQNSDNGDNSTAGEDGEELNPFINPDTLNKKNSGGYLRSKPVLISYVAASKKDAVVQKLSLVFDTNVERMNEQKIIETILQKSFRDAKRHRSLLVIINPHGGKGRAKSLYLKKCHPILTAAGYSIEIKYTEYGGHAIDIGRELDITKYDTIVCSSGDGIPYEILNGLFQREDRVEAFNKLTITQLPCGSGNAMSISSHWTSNPSYAAVCLVKGVESRIDLMCCSQQSYCDKFPKLSFLSQTYGIIAESDINTEFIRWMGPVRFDLGVAVNVVQGKKYPCEIYVKYLAKEKNEVKSHFIEHKQVNKNNDNELTAENFKLKYPLNKGVPDDWVKIDSELSNNIGIFYCGNMPYIAADTAFFPAALPSDGAIDMILTNSKTPLSKITPILLSIDKGIHVNSPEVVHSKVLAYKIVPKIKNGLFSVDGEKFPLEPLQVEIMPQLCKTILRNGCYIDTEFDKL